MFENGRIGGVGPKLTSQDDSYSIYVNRYDILERKGRHATVTRHECRDDYGRRNPWLYHDLLGSTYANMYLVMWRG